MLFGIAGPTASGKTTVTDVLTGEYGAAYMRYSLILSDIATERGLDPTDKATLQDLYVTLRETRGEDWLAKEVLQRARNIDSQNIVIEGNRRKVDLETLKAVASTRGEQLLLIFIDASPETRFVRYNSRLLKQGKPRIDWEAFLKLEQNPAEDEVPFLRDFAKQHGVYIDTDEYG
ncbi:AAA family ATPase, partial [Candidatus Kaiserbacteria bacterium]|nr:AAA family ATPase [Candidatus Kaiserbacteria bacterium]